MQLFPIGSVAKVTSFAA